MAPDQPRRFYIITSPRTGSNLLLKILALEDQPNVAFRRNGGYFFMPLVLLKAELRCSWKHVEQLSADQKAHVEECMKSCFNEFNDHIESAGSEGKIVVVKEHSNFLTDPVAKTRFLYGEESIIQEMPWTLRGPNELVRTTSRSVLNETILSDEFLNTWRPVFLIRHPALSFPSFYRASVRADGEEFTKSTPGRRACQMVMTMRWTRKLYDFYVDSFKECNIRADQETAEATWPIVLDADDIMTEPAVLVKLCNILGLDSDRLRYEWGPSNQSRPLWAQAFRTTLDSSTTIITTKVAGNVNIDEEGKKWKEEFGEEDGQMIENYVRAAMLDYEFLKSKKLRL
ncbi:uncharacterized protein N7473_008991 [Penicillium subrubescens]|jgi:hypothetical protein|uniref:Sulfotransferase domain-containing protein n=1 Tax=Penicillium subrubescens TaxID=1316194 RepID=A0A1Q5TGV0_9EURO|nr:uncharacterized protein N7473_008991 [Penicillium subrubescens]KAJ5886317.1 hypothetical protein N7473_008991 [Penicillium subrubescens]OKO99463.1 hypothetical protein PENSUB_8447 [Penicillium subrubescens]